MAATRLIHTLSALATIAIAFTPAMASAAPAGSFLTLSVDNKGRLEGSQSVLLRCEPTGGTHPRAAEACESLLSARGDFDQVSQQNHTSAPCPLVLRPAVVKADGTWRGKPVHFQKEFGNQCVASAKMGAVFDF